MTSFYDRVFENLETKGVRPDISAGERDIRKPDWIGRRRSIKQSGERPSLEARKAGKGRYKEAQRQETLSKAGLLHFPGSSVYSLGMDVMERRRKALNPTPGPQGRERLEKKAYERGVGRRARDERAAAESERAARAERLSHAAAMMKTPEQREAARTKRTGMTKEQRKAEGLRRAREIAMRKVNLPG